MSLAFKIKSYLRNRRWDKYWQRMHDDQLVPWAHSLVTVAQATGGTFTVSFPDKHGRIIGVRDIPYNVNPEDYQDVIESI